MGLRDMEQRIERLEALCDPGGKVVVLVERHEDGRFETLLHDPLVQQWHDESRAQFAERVKAACGAKWLIFVCFRRAAKCNAG